jgi:hypothetical protein
MQRIKSGMSLSAEKCQTKCSVRKENLRHSIPHRSGKSVPLHDQKCPHFRPARHLRVMMENKGKHEDDDIGDKSKK